MPRRRGSETPQSHKALVGSILVIDVVLLEILGLRVPELIYDPIFTPVWLGLPVGAGLAIFRYGL